MSQDSISHLPAESRETGPGVLGQLRQEYLAAQELMAAQPPIVQRYLETLAASLTEAVVAGQSQLHFKFPDRVVVIDQATGAVETLPVPEAHRDQMVGGLMERVTRADLRTALQQRLVELEQREDRAVATSAVLLRYAVVTHIVSHLLPSGRSVTYLAAEGEEIPIARRLHRRREADAAAEHQQLTPAEMDAVLDAHMKDNPGGERPKE